MSNPMAMMDMMKGKPVHGIILYGMIRYNFGLDYITLHLLHYIILHLFFNLFFTSSSISFYHFNIITL